MNVSAARGAVSEGSAAPSLARNRLGPVVAAFIGILLLAGAASALPSWITSDGTHITFTTTTGNTIVYSDGHLTDFYHNGVDYGGLAGGDHDNRGYKLIESYYFGPNQTPAGDCHDTDADFGGIVYADDSVAVVQAGCTQNPLDQELWRYVIPRDQSGFYEMERKNLTGYLEANNDQEVQFFNTSALDLYFSGRDGGITPIAGYSPLFTQFSVPNMPFSWEGGYDPVQNATLGFIQVGSDSLARTAHRWYPVVNAEQQLDFAGAGEADFTEMPLGATWFETWSGTVSGDATSLRQKALSLVGNTVDETITPFMSAADGNGGVVMNTGSLAYQPNPHLNYDVPYASGDLQLVTEYPQVNGMDADSGPDVAYFEDPWNTTYRNPDVSSAWMTYSVGNGAYQITNKKTAYRDADGLVWTYNITAQTAGNMTFSVNYGGSPDFTTSSTSNTLSEVTMDPIEGEYAITFIFPEPITVTNVGYTSTVTMNTRFMNPGDTASYTIYAIPHKWSNPVSITTFHTREQTTLKVPYRVLQTGLEWMPDDAVTAYDSSATGSGYSVSAFAEAGTHHIRMYSPDRIQSITTDQGTISFSQASDGSIVVDWNVPESTVGHIFLDTSNGVDFLANVTSGPAPLAVSFSDNSVVNPTSWAWDVNNDGTVDYTGPNVTALYTSVIGENVTSFDVTLNVTTANGPLFRTKTGYITEYPLQAAFTQNITAGASVPTTVSFTDMTTNGTPTSWNWSFGDGTFSGLQNPVHTYISPGIYDVSLNASNAYSYGLVVEKGLVSAGNQTMVSFTANVTSGTSPLAVGFTDTSSGYPTAWNWSFGDGGYAVTRNATHLYTVPGTYSIGLTASNSDGSNTTVQSNLITVLQPVPPVANFTANMTAGFAPLAVGFNDSSSGYPTAWNWSFGDNQFSGSQNPVHLYTTAGSYTVTLQASNIGGSNTTTRLNYIVASPALAPVADFLTNVSAGTSLVAVQFTDNSSYSPSSWVWIFTNVTGNNTPVTFSTARNPVLVLGGGNFSISLNASNSFGSNTTPQFRHWVNVSAPVTNRFVYDSYTTIMLHMNSTLTADDIGSSWVKDYAATPDSTVYKFGGYSGNFMTPGADMLTNARAPFNMGTGDFTVEGWINFANFANTNNYFVSSGISNGLPVNLFDVMYKAAPYNSWNFCDNGACNSFGNVPGNVTTGQWYAFAVSRVSGVDYFYVNGNLIGSRPDTTNIALGSNMEEVGSLSSTLGFVGHMDDVRVSKGLGRYSGASYPLPTTEFGLTGGGTSPVAGFTPHQSSGVSPLSVAFTDTSTGTPTSWSWSCTNVTGNNTPVTFSTLQSPTQVFGGGNFSIRLTAVNAYGSDTTPANLYWVNVSAATAPPVAGFTGTPVSGTMPLSVNFTDTSTGSPSFWNWSFGDGSYASVKNPTHIFSANGTFTITLTATNAGGSNVSTRTNYIAVILPAPVAGFAANTTSGSPPLTVSFTDQSSNSPVSWNWSFGDGNTSALQNPVHLYSYNGTFTVSLTATNAGGSNATVPTNYITVGAPVQPVSSFTANTTAGKAPLGVQFTDTSTGSPQTWNWSFGDGGVSSAQSPSHVYTSAGNYTVNLTVTNAAGSSTATRSGYIAVSPLVLPVAGFSANITTGKIPLAVQFTDASTGSPQTWNWTFGDGATSALQNPVHVYVTAGTYSVGLTVTNTDGLNSTTRSGYITASALVPPAANFTANVTSGAVPLAVQFTDKSTGSPQTWNWTFGDGATSAVQNPAHIYAAAGSYTVSLTATNGDGSNATTRAGYITVNTASPPVATFTANPTSGTTAVSVQFTDTSSNNPVSWVWTCTNVTGNNTPVVFSSVQNPVQVFGGGNFSVVLTASNSFGSNTSPQFLHWVNVSSATSSGRHGYDSYTTVMLHMNATPTVDDINSTWVKANSVASDSSVFRFGGASTKFTSLGNDMLTNARTPFNMGTGDFTIEGWVNFANFTNNYNYFVSAGLSGTSTPLNLFDITYRSSPDNYWAFCDNGVCNSFGDIPGSTATNQWYAFAVSRVSGVVYFYVNGNLIGSRADTTNIALGSNMEEIGSLSSTYGFTGHLDEIRVTKGLGRYSGASYPLQTDEFKPS